MSGYEEHFVGVSVPLPGFSAVLDPHVLKGPGPDTSGMSGFRSDHIHYTVVIDKDRRAPIYTALNIDQDRILSVSGKGWRYDPNFDKKFQNGPGYYRYNVWDKGHMAMRSSAAWGDTEAEAKNASDWTFVYSNASFQHEKFNGDEWRDLEYWVRDLQEASGGKVTSFTGPIYGSYSRIVEASDYPRGYVPAGFFKVVCFKREGSGDLGVRAFIMYQDASVIEGGAGQVITNFTPYQVTVTQIENLTGLIFTDEIRAANPLYFHQETAEASDLGITEVPESIEVHSKSDIISGGDTRTPGMPAMYITAAMVNAEGYEAHGEWVSVINVSANPVPLTGWTLSDEDPKHVLNLETIFGADYEIDPGQAVVVRPLRPVTLNNTGDTISLHGPSPDDAAVLVRVDEVTYTGQDAEVEGVPVVFGIRRSATT